MSEKKTLNLIWIIWCFSMLSYDQVYGQLDCPANYVCAYSTHFFIWTGKMATLNGAESICDNLGLRMLKVYNRGSINYELVQPNFTQVIQADTTIWLSTWYDSIKKEYRWLETNELFDFDQPDSSAGECLVIKDNVTRIAPAACGDKSHVVCMEKTVYWFGSSPRFICHCSWKSCRDDGTCVYQDASCAHGWFGEGCQLRDALLNVRDRLLDFSQATCDQRSEEVAFPVNPPTYFSWIRIVSKDKVDQNTFSVAVTMSEQTILCPGAKSFVIANDTVDIVCCTNVSLVTGVVVRWRGTRTLCSVHMYRGQNVASQGMSTVTSNSRVYDAGFSVDGRRDIISHTFSSTPTRAPDSWSLDFNMEKIVFEVIIYVKEALLKDLSVTLEFQSLINTSVHRNNPGASTFPQGTQRLRLLSGTKEKVKRVKILFVSTSGSPGNNLDLSEVEVYGDCNIPGYSLYCNVSCETSTSSTTTTSTTTTTTTTSTTTSATTPSTTTTTTTVTTPSTTTTTTSVTTPSTTTSTTPSTTTSTTTSTTPSTTTSTTTSVTTPSTTTMETQATTTPVTTPPIITMESGKTEATATTTSVTTPSTTTNNESTPLFDDNEKKRDQKKENYSMYYFLLIPFIGITLIMLYKLRDRTSHHEDISKESMAEDKEPSKNKEADPNFDGNSDHVEPEDSRMDIESHVSSEHSKHSPGVNPGGAMQTFSENKDETKTTEMDETLHNKWSFNKINYYSPEGSSVDPEPPYTFTSSSNSIGKQSDSKST